MNTEYLQIWLGDAVKLKEKTLSCKVGLSVVF